jgi:hypothetical protein
MRNIIEYRKVSLNKQELIAYKKLSRVLGKIFNLSDTPYTPKRVGGVDSVKGAYNLD